MALIHEAICKVMSEIGAIGKDQKNLQQNFNYRGIDDVYNALNPLMAKHGIFICPEVVDQKREERAYKDRNGNEKAIMYSLLTIKYTVFATDGSSITLMTVGEAMDSGDKGMNKAMSIAMKYAMFQLFCIPTKEMTDPDAESFDNVTPKSAAKPTTQAEVTKANKVPAPENPVVDYLAKMCAEFGEEYGLDEKTNKKLFNDRRLALMKAGLAPMKPAANYTMEEAMGLVDAMHKCFDIKSAELKTT